MTDHSRYPVPPPGKHIAIGGLALHAQQMGTGTPVVVFENGLGSNLLQWGYIQPRIAAATTTVSYDRAGQGWSDSSTAPRSLEQMATELHELLHALELPAPYILVAHSYGGMVVRTFAHRYPNEVRGMVLVDSSHEMQLAAVPDYARTHTMMLRALRVISLVVRLPGMGRFLASRMFARFRSHMPDETWQHFVAVAALPKHFDTMRGEMQYFGEAFGATSSVPKAFGDLPLTVITAADSLKNDPPPGKLSAEAATALHHRLQGELPKMSSRGTHVMVEGATHFSILSDPTHIEYVTAAIHALLEQP